MNFPIKLSSHLACGWGPLSISEASANHGVPHAVTPELLLPTGLIVNDWEPSLVQRLSK